MKQYTHTFKKTIHWIARVCGTVATSIKDCKSDVYLTHNDDEPLEKAVDAREILDLMMLAMTTYRNVSFQIDGPDEDEVITRLKAAFEEAEELYGVVD